jgi:hypothetical protein
MNDAKEIQREGRIKHQIEGGETGVGRESRATGEV